LCGRTLLNLLSLLILYCSVVCFIILFYTYNIIRCVTYSVLNSLERPSLRGHSNRSIIIIPTVIVTDINSKSYRVPSCDYKRLCKIIIIQTHRRLDNKLITIFSDVLAYLYSIIIYCISRYFYNVHTRIIYGESTVRAEFFVQSGGNEVCTSIGSFVFFSVFLLPPVLQLFVTGENHTIFYWIYYIIHYIIIHAFYTTRCYTHSL